MSSIKEARIKAGYKQKEVSKITGIPLGTLRRWEQGINEPNVDSIITLADLYGTSTDELLGSGFSVVLEYNTDNLTDDEKKLVKLYRQCSHQGREYLLQIASVTAGIFGS